MPINPATIKRLREQRGLTQEQAAAAAGIAQGRWSDYETGRRQIVKLEVLERVATALGVRAGELLK